MVSTSVPIHASSHALSPFRSYTVAGNWICNSCVSSGTGSFRCCAEVNKAKAYLANVEPDENNTRAQIDVDLLCGELVSVL